MYEFLKQEQVCLACFSLDLCGELVFIENNFQFTIFNFHSRTNETRTKSIELRIKN